VTRRALPAGALVAALVALLTVGCDAPARTATGASGTPASCLRAPSPGASPATTPSPGASPAGAPASAAGRALPDVSLPCFSGGGQVRLAALGRPAVLNLWASWCTPCRTEMPAIQRYAARAAGRVAVIGVDTGDTRTGGGSVIQDLGVTYPNLYDERQLLLHGVEQAYLPVTILVDARGAIRHLYASGEALTEASLARLVQTYLGVS
jgi:thiol-disulfide isomerase/thioredoxin